MKADGITPEELSKLEGVQVSTTMEDLDRRAKEAKYKR